MKPKVLFILHIPPPVHGASMVGSYIKESKTINSQFDCDYINLGTSKTLEEIGKSFITKLYRFLSLYITVLKQLIIKRPQLVYITINAKGFGFYKDAFIVLLVKLFNVKIVFHLHNKGVQTRQHLFIDNLLYKIVFKNTDVILLSNFLYDDIKKYVPLSMVHICPNGLPDYFNSCKKKSVKKTSSLLFLSNMMESKGVYVLLKALRILKYKKIPFECTFIGAESDITNFSFDNKLIVMGLQDEVQWVGKKYGSEKEEYFNNADLFIFPTYYETFGLVNLEAMQYSLPVVSTYEGGIADVIENNVTGILVEKKNVVALANAIQTLIENPSLRMEMGKKGRERYLEKFTLTIFERNMASILSKIIK